MLGERDSALEVKYAPKSRHFQGHFLRGMKMTNMVFDFDMFVKFWMKNAKQPELVWRKLSDVFVYGLKSSSETLLDARLLL